MLNLQNNLSLKSVQSIKQNLKVRNLIFCFFAADHERTNERLRKFSLRDVRFDLQHERKAERRLHLQPELKLEIWRDLSGKTRVLRERRKLLSTETTIFRERKISTESRVFRDREFLSAAIIWRTTLHWRKPGLFDKCIIC